LTSALPSTSRISQSAQQELPLQRHVDQGEDQQHRCHRQQTTADQLARRDQCLRQGQREQRAVGGSLRGQVPGAGRAEEQREQAGLQRVAQLLRRQQSLQPGDRVELLRPWVERLPGEVPAASQHAGAEGHRHAQRADRQHRQQEPARCGHQPVDHRRRVTQRRGVEAQPVCHRARERAGDLRSEGADQGDGAAQRGQVRQVPRTRDLALLARFLDLARGGGKAAVFLGGVGHVAAGSLGSAAMVPGQAVGLSPIRAGNAVVIDPALRL